MSLPMVTLFDWLDIQYKFWEMEHVHFLQADVKVYRQAEREMIDDAGQSCSLQAVYGKH